MERELMQHRSRLLDDFASAFHDIDDDRAFELLDLSEGELSELAAGVESLPNPVQAACHVMLADWRQLDAAGRVAALLVLANALADVAVDRVPPMRCP